jgi:hypothetical protein
MFTDVSEVLPLMMEAARTSETSVNFYQTTRRNPEDIHFHNRRRENLKSHRADTLINTLFIGLSLYFQHDTTHHSNTKRGVKS